jgi:3-hydroxymyristoyl/3-hydroxydecanoyl-(acyl carrier protein) dehydratase
VKRARLVFPASHPAFAGHFPGMPVVPGALLLAAALDALGAAGRGVFTSAQQAKPGQLELAAGGVLFLDEVTEMSLSAQAKFLRPVGPDCPVEASCEAIATGALRLELRAGGQLVASALLGHASA